MTEAGRLESSFQGLGFRLQRLEVRIYGLGWIGMLQAQPKQGADRCGGLCFKVILHLGLGLRESGFGLRL